jgi:hypothetical protein
MTLNEFNELENKIGKDEFNREYKNINTVMFLLSIFGHIASIFLAYFLVSTIISTFIGVDVVISFRIGPFAEFDFTNNFLLNLVITISNVLWL